MKLYYSTGAPSLAPHIALREAGRTFDLDRVDLGSLRTASGRDYLEINPKGTVPALELDGGSDAVISETPVILQYIGDLAPDRHLIPPQGTFARYHAQEWLSFIASELQSRFLPLLTPGVPQATQSSLRGHIGDRMLHLADVLHARGYLMGETFTVCDAYLYVMLLWCDRSGIDLALWPNLEDYATKLEQRPAFQAALRAERVHGHHRLLEPA